MRDRLCADNEIGLHFSQTSLPAALAHAGLSRADAEAASMIQTAVSQDMNPYLIHCPPSRPVHHHADAEATVQIETTVKRR
jgi:hypothetical protein